MLEVSAAVLRGASISDSLDRVAREAAGVIAGADRASIILIEGPKRHFRLAGSYGLSDHYVRLLSTGEAKLRPGVGPSGIAYADRRPVIVDDVDEDPVIKDWPWRDIAHEGGYRGIVSIPLMPGGDMVGTLNVYRADAGSWRDKDIRVLRFFAEHAAHAVRTAQLLDQRSKQVSALQTLVRALGDQSHEYANRLHAVSGLLALGEVDEAREFLAELEGAHVAAHEALDSRISVPIVAAFLMAEIGIAAQRGVRISLSEESSLRWLPRSLSDTQVVTILGNLLANAFDAVATLPASERTVQVHLLNAPSGTVFEVINACSDDLDLDRAFERGFSMKPGHLGVGLSLIQEAVAAAMGVVEVQKQPGETVFRVSIPDD